MTQQPQRQFLKDYQPPAFTIDRLHLIFEIQDKLTLVTNQMQFRRQRLGDLILQGPQGRLKTLALRTPRDASFRPCREGTDFLLQEDTLKLLDPPEEFTLECTTTLHPSENTSLQGLYRTGTGLCTQCEPEGFRQMTFFLDRPDVMARYKTTLIADKKKFPILLSNGNRIETSDLSQGRHQVTWDDPFPKPSYLFALVAGNYGVLKDHFITKSGRRVELEIYCEPGNEFQCHHALAALKRSMKWDEETYNREYDLDHYLILAVDDFNGGAMENKGLNIFNSRLIFADKTTATDTDFENVESVIAHEYFHNWTGNRITLRDWFQLSLKEGLTVFREQHYMATMTSPKLKRIDEVEFLRSKQFPEDAGPNAHPVQPASCLAVDNFYTVTVYEKGAEVIRVLKQLIGAQNFQRGMALYFEKYDGRAITIDDFLNCFAEVSAQDLSVFRRWYHQSGTPTVLVEEVYDQKQQTYTLKLTQPESVPTPGPGARKEGGFTEPSKQPFAIPFKLSLFSPTTKRGYPIGKEGATEVLLTLSEREQSWHFSAIDTRPVPSFLREFTSPIELKWEPTFEQLEFLAKHDTDGFNQWESVQKLSHRELLALYQARASKGPFQKTGMELSSSYVALYRFLLESALKDPSFSGRLLQLPNKEYLVQTLPLGFDPEALSDAYETLQKELAQTLAAELWSLEEQIHSLNQPEDNSFKMMGLRKLRQSVWNLLGHHRESTARLSQKFQQASTMNDQAGLLEALNQIPNAERTAIGEQFLNQWKDNSLVVNKWLGWHASLNHPDTLKTVSDLSQGPYFKASNPNKVRALWGTFAQQCWRGFHQIDGHGYQYLGQCVLEVDGLNPSTGARLSHVFENWYRLEPGRREQAKKVLAELLNSPKLSKNTFEILKRSFDFEKAPIDMGTGNETGLDC